MKDVLEFIFSSFWHWLGIFAFLVVLVRWKIFYLNITTPAAKPKEDTKGLKDTSFWKDLADITKKPPKPPDIE